MRVLCLASLFKWCVSTTIFSRRVRSWTGCQNLIDCSWACISIDSIGFCVHRRIKLMWLMLMGFTCTTHFFIVCAVSGHEVAVGISSVTAALVYLLIWSDLVFPERSRFCDRCWWIFYVFIFFICITGDMVLLWYWQGMFRPNLVFLIAMFVTSWRFQFMHIFSAYNEDFTKKTSL